MKKLILFFAIFALTVNLAMAGTVQPQQLTRKQSVDYRLVNSVTAKTFANLPQKIDTTKYSPTYQNYKLMLPEKSQSPRFYYVKQGQAELMYDKSNNMLRYITFRQPFMPRTWVVYNFPSGNLRQVDVWLYLDEIYSFNSDGVYIDYDTYKEAIYDVIKSNWSKEVNGKKVKKSKPAPELLITIDYKGNIQQCKALKQSASEEYNNTLYEAVWKSSPFNVPYPFTTITTDVQLEFE